MATATAVGPLVRWIATATNCITNRPSEWKLVVGRGKRPYVAASVWDNGVWHTWDRHGVGLENSAEHDHDPVERVRRAKVEAAASVIAQGLI